MQILYCTNCHKVTGFKKSMGVGTFLGVIVTCGLLLLFLPWYPNRCVICGAKANASAVDPRQLMADFLSRRVTKQDVIKMDPADVDYLKEFSVELINRSPSQWTKKDHNNLFGAKEIITKKCPYCAEDIKKEAILCRFCGKDLEVKENV